MVRSSALYTVALWVDCNKYVCLDVKEKLQDEEIQKKLKEVGQKVWDNKEDIKKDVESKGVEGLFGSFKKLF